jgi:hypothetical protein
VAVPGLGILEETDALRDDFTAHAGRRAPEDVATARRRPGGWAPRAQALRVAPPGVGSSSDDPPGSGVCGGNGMAGGLPTEAFFPVSGSLLRRRPRPGGNTACSSPSTHGGHHAGTAGRTGPGGGQRQPGWLDLLEVATQLEPFEVMGRPQARSACSRSRRYLRRSQALLHP